MSGAFALVVTILLGGNPGDGVGQVGSEAVVYRLDRGGEPAVVWCTFDWLYWDDLLKAQAADDAKGIAELQAAGHASPIASGTKALILAHQTGYLSDGRIIPFRMTNWEVRITTGPLKDKVVRLPYDAFRAKPSSFGPGIVPDESSPEAYARSILASDKSLFAAGFKVAAEARAKALAFKKNTPKRREVFAREVRTGLSKLAETYGRTFPAVVKVILAGIAYGWPNPADPKFFADPESAYAFCWAIEPQCRLEALAGYRLLIEKSPKAPEAKLARQRIANLNRPKTIRVR